MKLLHIVAVIAFLIAVIMNPGPTDLS